MQERTEYQRGTSKDISSTRIFGSNGKQNEEVTPSLILLLHVPKRKYRKTGVLFSRKS